MGKTTLLLGIPKTGAGDVDTGIFAKLLTVKPESSKLDTETLNKKGKGGFYGKIRMESNR